MYANWTPQYSHIAGGRHGIIALVRCPAVVLQRSLCLSFTSTLYLFSLHVLLTPSTLLGLAVLLGHEIRVRLFPWLVESSEQLSILKRIKCDIVERSWPDFSIAEAVIFCATLATTITLLATNKIIHIIHRDHRKACWQSKIPSVQFPRA